jgi:hypothetical protein
LVKFGQCPPYLGSDALEVGQCGHAGDRPEHEPEDGFHLLFLPDHSAGRIVSRYAPASTAGPNAAWIASAIGPCSIARALRMGPRRPAGHYRWLPIAVTASSKFITVGNAAGGHRTERDRKPYHSQRSGYAGAALWAQPFRDSSASRSGTSSPRSCPNRKRPTHSAASAPTSPTRPSSTSFSKCSYSAPATGASPTLPAQPPPSAAATVGETGSASAHAGRPTVLPTRGADRGGGAAMHRRGAGQLCPMRARSLDERPRLAAKLQVSRRQRVGSDMFPSQGGSAGSNPVGATIQQQAEHSPGHLVHPVTVS